MLTVLLLGFMAGITFTLLMCLFAILKLTNFSQEPGMPPLSRLEQFSPSIIPKVLKDYFAARTEAKPEQAAIGVNLLLMFLFQELKNTEKLRSWFQEKIEIELMELKCHSAVQLIVRDLKLDSFDLGNSLPLVQVVRVDTEPQLDSAGKLETVDLTVDLSYTGEIQVALEAQISFDRTLVFICKLLSLSGQGRLRFTRTPYTNWSFSFTSEPNLNLDLKSNLNGRNIPQIIIPLLTNQIKRLIKKKHTLPAYKMRVRPFFITSNYRESRYTDRTVPSSQSLDMTLVSCSRILVDVENSSGIYCILTVDSKQYAPKLPFDERIFTVTLSGLPNQRVQGLSLKIVSHHLLKRNVAMVDKVKAGSPCSLAGLVKGDIITHINDESIAMFDITRIRSLLIDTDDESVTLTVVEYKDPTQQSKTLPSVHSDSAIPEGGEELDNVSVDTQVSGAEKGENDQQTRNKTQRSIKNRSKSKDRDNKKLHSSISSSDLRKSTNKYLSSTVTPKAESEFGDTFKVSVNTEHLYINVALFSINKSALERDRMSGDSQEGSAGDSLLGYASVSIPDMLLSCSSTPQNVTQVNVSLKGPADGGYVPRHPGARELDPTRCYGDVTLRFAVTGSSPDITIGGSSLVIREGADGSENGYVDIDFIRPKAASSSTGAIPEASHRVAEHRENNNRHSAHLRHSFREHAFTHAVSCNFCSKKIWFKKAMRCQDCHMITHKKCAEQCQIGTKCSRIPIASQLKGSNESLAAQSDVPNPDVQSGSEQLGRAARVIQRFRRGKSHAKAAQTKILTDSKKKQNLQEKFDVLDVDSSSEEGAPTYGVREDLGDTDSCQASGGGIDADSSSDDDTAIERQFMKEFLSKQESNDQGSAFPPEESDELVITAAKQMGKELYASLDIEERKCKLEAMVEKFQSEIEMVSAVRDDQQKSLRTCATTLQKQIVTTRIQKADEKMQALAVLLLHYCSGLQDCAEQLEREKTEAPETGSEGSSYSADRKLCRNDTLRAEETEALDTELEGLLNSVAGTLRRSDTLVAENTGYSDAEEDSPSAQTVLEPSSTTVTHRTRSLSTGSSEWLNISEADV